MEDKTTKMTNDLKEHLSKPPKIFGKVVPLFSEFPKAKFTIGDKVRILNRKKICVVDKIGHISIGYVYALNGPKKYAWYNEKELEKYDKT